MVNAGWFGSMQSEIFLQICLTKQVSFLPGQLAPPNQFLIQPLFLFKNVILQKMSNLGS